MDNYESFFMYTYTLRPHTQTHRYTHTFVRQTGRSVLSWSTPQLPHSREVRAGLFCGGRDPPAWDLSCYLTGRTLAGTWKCRWSLNSKHSDTHWDKGITNVIFTAVTNIFPIYINSYHESKKVKCLLHRQRESKRFSYKTRFYNSTWALRIPVCPEPELKQHCFNSHCKAT